MSNTNNNFQTQTSNALHNAIMEAGGKDRPPMLAPGNYVQWKSRIKRYIDIKPNNELIHYCLQNLPYKFKWTKKTVPVAEGIDNDIYSIIDACPNACEMWKAIERLKQGESINVQDLKTNLYWEFGKFTSRDGESLESYYSRFYKMMNELVRNQCDVTNHQVNVQFLLQLQPEWQRFVTLVKQSQELKTVSYHKLYDILKQHQNEVNEIRAERLACKAIVNSPSPTYDTEPEMVAEDDALSKEKKIDKLVALISQSFKKINKPTNNNLRTSSNTSRANQDNSPRINRGTGYNNQKTDYVTGARKNVGTQVVQQSRIQCYNCKEYGHVARECHKLKQAKDAAYHKEKMLLCKQEEAGFQLNAEQADWRDDTDDEPGDQELEAHYMYMAQIQEVTLDAADNSGPIFDTEPLQKVQNDDDNYNVFANEKEHPEQPEFVNGTYLEEQGDTNITTDSLDMNTNGETVDQDDDDLAKERDLLASLIEKLKCEIDDSKNRNKFLESSNNTLVNKLKGEIEDFKNKNKSLESSNNHFKEANKELSKTNQLMFKDLKKFQAELDRYHDVNYMSKVELDCAKAKNEINKLFAHQETISIMSQEKEAQEKVYKTREEKELEKVIALENKIKFLDDIVYKTGQSVQTMNLLNRNCKISFVKPEFLKKAQRVNPRMYDIGCYNDNLALMLARESDETIHLAQESRSKLSDLIKPFDYKNLNNLYDLFVPQREKSPEQRYFSERSKMSHTPVKNENSKESFNKHTTLLERRMDESIPWDQKCKSSKELFKIKSSVDTIFDGVERCKQTIAKRTYFGHIDPFIQNTIEGNFCPQIQKINADLEKFHLCLKEEMVADLRYFNSLENEVDSLKSQLETQKTQFLNEIDRLSREYYYADHMNAILGVYTKLDEVTNLQCDYLEALEKCQSLENELSKRNTMSKSFEALQQHAINLELALHKQNLKAQLQDKNIAISELKKLIAKMKGKYVETKTKKPMVVPISARKPKQKENHSVATPLKKTVASKSTNQKPRSITIKQYEHIWKLLFWKSTCYIRNLKGNDLLTGSRGPYLYSITLQDTSTTNLICLMSKASSSQARLWHRHLSHLNFDTINLLSKYDILTGLPKLKIVKDHHRSSSELGKSKRKSFKT
ncbi:retrovirus-related pol polyprotein from transposon TNT 1-94 [Tanacetum coccineum]